MIFICSCLISIIVTRKFTPTCIDLESHSSLLNAYISAGADMLDLTEYAKNDEIVELLGGIDLIYGKRDKIIEIKVFFY